MSDESVMSAKIALRKQIQSTLKKLGRDEKIRQSEIVAQKVLRNEKFIEAKSVSIYLNMDDEVQTEQLLIQIFKQNKDCFIPRFSFGSPEMEMVRLPTIDDYHKLQLNKWNIKQPANEQDLESVFDKGELELVLTPGLAFTAAGDRLGRGKGYYDKFFDKCRRNLKKFPYLIGLAFNEQLLTAIPTSENDVRLDLVINAAN